MPVCVCSCVCETERAQPEKGALPSYIWRRKWAITKKIATIFYDFIAHRRRRRQRRPYMHRAVYWATTISINCIQCRVWCWCHWCDPILPFISWLLCFPYHNVSSLHRRRRRLKAHIEEAARKFETWISKSLSDQLTSLIIFVDYLRLCLSPLPLPCLGAQFTKVD